MTKVVENIMRIVSAEMNMDVEAVKPESDLESLGADSLNVTNIVMEVEDKYDISISDEEMQKFRKVDDVIRLVTAKIA
jgi:acyl carrier protein